MSNKYQVHGKNRAAFALLGERSIENELNSIFSEVVQNIPPSHPVEISTISRSENLEIEEIRKRQEQPAVKSIHELYGFCLGLIEGIDVAKRSGVVFRERNTG